MTFELHSLRFTDFFSLALGYCFIFYTGGLFFYDLRPVNLNYFHKFCQTVFHMVQTGHALIFDQGTLPAFECIDEMAHKSVLGSFVLKCSEGGTLGHFGGTQ